jgi:SSS family solute:Na+ symporter
MAKDPTQAKRSFLIAGLLSIPFYAIVVLIGLCAVLMFPSSNPNHAFLNVINGSLPIVFKGIAISGIMAVIMSTADSLLNVASISVRDVAVAVLPRKLNDLQELLLARFSTVFLGVMSIFVAVRFQSLWDLWLFVANFWMPIISPPMLLYVLFNIKTSVKTYVTGVLIGICAVLAYRYSVPEVYKALSPVIGVFAAMIAMLILWTMEINSKKTALGKEA